MKMVLAIVFSLSASSAAIITSHIFLSVKILANPGKTLIEG